MSHSSEISTPISAGVPEILPPPAQPTFQWPGVFFVYPLRENQPEFKSICMKYNCNCLEFEHQNQK
jgi:hypothetical protein